MLARYAISKIARVQEDGVEDPPRASISNAWAVAIRRGFFGEAGVLYQSWMLLLGARTYARFKSSL